MGHLAASHPVRFVVGAGDNFYKKGVTSVDDERFQSTFEKVYSAPSLASLRFYHALGNHDYRGNFFAQVNYTQRSSRWYMPHTYYSEVVPLANLQVLLVVLDVPLLERCAVNPPGSKRCWDGGRQMSWLRSTLEENVNIKWKFVVGHYPIHANGPHVNHRWLADPLKAMFREFGVSMYINADNHYVQVCRADGVDFVNSGGGAGYLRHKPADKGYKEDPASLFIHLADGPVLHCLSKDGSVLRNAIVDAPSNKVVYSWETTPNAATTPHRLHQMKKTSSALAAPSSDGEEGSISSTTMATTSSAWIQVDGLPSTGAPTPTQPGVNVLLFCLMIVFLVIAVTWKGRIRRK
eukprot:PhM_4_TR3632/c0_g1_i1/m.27715/K14379/ACP5; tartrate-resistant acid phosphatase type 5